jgi:hypothetical protein
MKTNKNNWKHTKTTGNKQKQMQTKKYNSKYLCVWVAWVSKYEVRIGQGFWGAQKFQNISKAVKMKINW